METEILFFKDKFICGTDVEIIFHKDYTHIYNIEKFPIVKYTLYNCKDLVSKKFESIDAYNDGVYIEFREVDNHFLFESIDLGGETFQIYCDKVIKEEQEYRKQDLIDLIKDLQRQSNEESEITKGLHQKLDAIKIFLDKEVELNQRKLNEANWLGIDKKHFLQGELHGFKKILNLLTVG